MVGSKKGYEKLEKTEFRKEREVTCAIVSDNIKGKIAYILFHKRKKRIL